MKVITLELQLLDDAIFSETAATTGNHKSLTHIPGATLLGWVASRLYAKLDDPQLQFDMFHSGKVRFCNGNLSDDNNQSTLPTPLAWHYKKNQDIYKDTEDVIKTLNSQKIYNHSAADFQREDGEQYKQLRGSFINNSGQVFSTAKRYTMKTAIDSHTGRAATGQLFGYDAIAASSRFIATIQFDNGLNPRIEKAITELLKPNTQMRLGRSRSAQFSRTKLTGIRSDNITPEHSHKTTLTLWLQSDMALYQDGQPTLQANAQSLDIPEIASLQLDKTHLRFRKYSPYHGFRRAYDLERQVLSAGSVLSFKLSQPLSRESQQRIQAGLGAWREHGLGQVIANPTLLEQVQPSFTTQENTEDKTSQSKTTTCPDATLYAWLNYRANKQSTQLSVQKTGYQLATTALSLYQQARRYNGIASSVDYGPSKTQWGHIYELAREAKTNDDLKAALFEGANAAINAQKDEDWEIAYSSQTSDKLPIWLNNQLSEASNNSTDVIAHMAHQLRNLNPANYQQLAAALKKQENAA